MSTKRTEYTPAQRKAIRLRRISEGKCVACSSAAVPGRTLCERHLRARKERYYKQKGLGLCTVCSTAKAIPGTTRCEVCKESSRVGMKKARLKRLEEYRCICCGAPLDKDADGERVSCVNCRENLNRFV